MALSEEERKKIKQEQEEKDRRSNCKQHCSKIDEKLNKLPQNASSRAIWELVQNARDLSNDCEIVITLKSNELIFQHNGKPFNYDSLSSLVKQVSSEAKEGEDTVGQYGTGFVTTHSFSKVIRIDGYFEIKEDEYVKLDNFVIDREYSSTDEFIQKMSAQLKIVENLVDKPTTKQKEDVTKLKYQLDEGALHKARKGFDDAKSVIPYVLILNPRIKKIILNDEINDYAISYTKAHSENKYKNENGLIVYTCKNGEETECEYFYLDARNGLNEKDIIIIPLIKYNGQKISTNIKDVAKLFLFFPLLGTETFGMNFIFHSSRFVPKEERDGIFLPNTNENTKSKYENNKSVLYEMTDKLFDWLGENLEIFPNPIEIASLLFKPSINDNLTIKFISDFKSKWVAKFETLPLIKIGDVRFAISDKKIKVFSSDILDFLQTEEDVERYLPTIYRYASEVSRLPVQEEILRWSQIIGEWGCRDYYITLDDIASKISENTENLLTFLEFIKICGKTEMFNKYPLIPNREGQLKKAKDLYKASEIDPILYSIVKGLISKVDQLVSEDFANIIELPNYSRKDLLTDITARILSERKDTIGNSKAVNPFDLTFKKHLLAYCSIFYQKNGESNRNKLMKIICKLNNCEYEEFVISKTDNEPDLFSTAMFNLVENQMVEIGLDNTIADRFDILYNFLKTCLFVKEYDKLISENSVFPNCNKKLCLREDLFVNNGIDDELISLYNNVMSEDLKDKLVMNDFANLISEDREKLIKIKPLTAIEVAEKIEKQLKDDSSNPIIIEIIEQLDDGKWKDEGMFEYIKKNKEELFFKSVQGNSKKNVYKLMKKDSKTLELLADLSDEPNLKEILDLAKRKIEEDRYKRNDFEFKHKIGIHIQDMIQKRISDELSSFVEVDVVDDQDGQDMIVFVNGNQIYFIEVKSKWNFTEPAHMSRNQMNKAARNPEKYSLVCVDLTKEEDRYYPEIDSIIDKIYIHSNIGNELKPIMDGVINTDKENDEDTIKMGGNYQCNIPKKIFVKGEPFETLIEIIVDKIKTL